MPILRQLPRSCRSQHRLAKSLEDGGHEVKAFAAGVYTRKEGVEFVSDAFLFGEGRHRNVE